MGNIKMSLQPQMWIQVSHSLLQFMMAGGSSTCSGQIFLSRDVQVKGQFKPSTHINECSSITWYIHSFPSAINIFYHLELPGGNLLYGGKEEQEECSECIISPFITLCKYTTFFFLFFFLTPTDGLASNWSCL